MDMLEDHGTDLLAESAQTYSFDRNRRVPITYTKTTLWHPHAVLEDVPTVISAQGFGT